MYSDSVLGKSVGHGIGGTPACGNGFHCEKSGLCVPQSFKCDGEVDCGSADDSDERNCGAITCNPGKFACKDAKLCIPRLFVCDGEKDCVDNSDESDCPSD